MTINNFWSTYFKNNNDRKHLSHHDTRFLKFFVSRNTNNQVSFPAYRSWMWIRWTRRKFLWGWSRMEKTSSWLYSREYVIVPFVDVSKYNWCKITSRGKHQNISASFKEVKYSLNRAQLKKLSYSFDSRLIRDWWGVFTKWVLCLWLL